MIKSNLRRLAFFVGLVALWMLVAKAGIWNQTLFPDPIAVGKTLQVTFSDGTMWIAIKTSMTRVLLGYSLSLAIGVPLGIMIARIRILDETLGALVAGLQTLPSICWLPLALLWFGLNDNAIIFVIVMGSLVSIAVAVQDGVKNLPPTYVRAARTLGAKGLPLYVQVLLPASLPAILIGAKLGWAYAWRALMSGELLFVSIGLGHMLMMGRELADMSQVIAVMLVIIAIGVLADKVFFGQAEARVRRRFGLASS